MNPLDTNHNYQISLDLPVNFLQNVTHEVPFFLDGTDTIAIFVMRKNIDYMIEYLHMKKQCICIDSI